MLEDDLRIPELVRRSKDLEHLEMETKPSSFLEAVAEIGLNCPWFVGLKVRGLIGREDAKALARCLPELKHLELSKSYLSKSYLTKDELLVVISGCRKLETLTVKDCLGFQADDEILKLVSRIERFEHEGFVDKSVHMFDQRNLTSGGVGAPVHKLDGHKWFLDKASIFRRAAEDGFLNIWDYEG
ncbi:hypothetical protein ZIOFF_062730 [Zingiber officinale]|uniref:Uncharacterized protein n=1 Tax=Zingiber officinale TaxID=94328 RepID=A0A8J5F184_ZINOF|nr:hypothetical protein ZIOFF_062730 [Zingiber officinale]